MRQEQERGFTEEQAAAIVSKEAGHERTDVIAIYQGGFFAFGLKCIADYSEYVIINIENVIIYSIYG